MFKDKIVNLLSEETSDLLNEFHTCEFRTKKSDWDSEEVNAFRQVLDDNSITFKIVDNYGGEDQGSDYWSVYAFSDGMQVVFIKFDGWYASYDGSTFHEFYEVKAVEKTITVFEKK